ncbi:MAG: antirestriction protein [Enterobacteriaceae bacterium]
MTSNTKAEKAIVTSERTAWLTGYDNLNSLLVQHGFSQLSAIGHVDGFTRLCYVHAGVFSKDYSSDYWHWYTLSDGGFFICPRTEKTYRIEVYSNHYQGEMSAQALGITVSLYALCAMAESGYGFFIELYQRLRGYALQHPEGAEIGAAID